jgi:hypothetical protein
MTLRHERRLISGAIAMTSPDTITELDSRTSDGIEVRLLWHPVEHRVTVTAWDTRSGETLEIAVREGDSALDVFHHPYGYAAFYRVEARPDTRPFTPTLTH